MQQVISDFLVLVFEDAFFEMGQDRQIVLTVGIHLFNQY